VVTGAAGVIGARKHERTDQALYAVVMEAYVAGVSTRRRDRRRGGSYGSLLSSWATPATRSSTSELDLERAAKLTGELRQDCLGYRW
jgi:hypothetical protein